MRQPGAHKKTKTGGNRWSPGISENQILSSWDPAQGQPADCPDPQSPTSRGTVASWAEAFGQPLRRCAVRPRDRGKVVNLAPPGAEVSYCPRSGRLARPLLGISKGRLVAQTG